VTADVVDPSILEPVTARAWRPAQEDRLGEWRLNASLGFSGRINACWPIGDSGYPLEVAIERVEAWYEERRLSPRFKLVDGARPDVEGALMEAGYGRGAATLVMTGPARGAAHPQVAVRSRPDARFSAVFTATSADPLDAQERLGALERTPDPAGFALMEVEGEPAAIGACAVEAPFVGIFAMRTIPSARGRGLARQVLDTLLAHAGAVGGQTAWLQVEAENAIARRLYERAGLSAAYAYRYWRRP
jgi:ribosomal protein S18 acetylase RimI-like enzyme